MYKVGKANSTSLNVNKSNEGETIEQKIDRVVNNREPITDGAPQIYTERRDGVQPAYNIRSDRFDIAIDAMDKVTGSHKAKREEKALAREAKVVDLPQQNNGGAESTQGTN